METIDEITAQAALTYAQLSAAVYESGGAGITDPNWIRIENAPPGTDGFFAATFQNTATGEIVIAFRGTDGPFDIMPDVETALGTLSPQLSQAAAYYLDVVSRHQGEQVNVTGHSLGGALASYVAATDPLYPSTVQATVFNALGISNIDGITGGNYTNITNFNTLLDPVHSLPLINQIGTSYALPLIGTTSWFSTFAKALAGFAIPAGVLTALDFFSKQHTIDIFVNADFTTAQRFTRPLYCDPLALDLNNNGLETVGINTANPILFDHNGDGVKTATGWVAPSDGLLVWDKNGNGAIDSGRELFGDATLKSNGLLATDGFDALADLDSNLDGKVDSSDANFANLKVWRDLNQDGITQAGELTTLAAQNILSFNVAKTSNSVTLANGNQIADLGSYTRSDGSQATLGNVTGSLADINLASNPFYSQFTDTIPLTQEAQALPDMHGSGMVRSLREAASPLTTEGAALAATVAEFAAGAYDAHQATIDNLIQQWSATSTLSTTIGGAYGARPLTINLEGITTGSPAYTAFLDKLSTLERFNGQTFRTIPADPVAPVSITILRENQNLIEQSYQALKQSVYNSLVVQTRLKPYFDAITLNLTAGEISTDFSGINTMLDTLKTTDPSTELRTGFKYALYDLIELNLVSGKTLYPMGWTGAEKLSAWVEEAALDPAMLPVLQFFATATEGRDVLLGQAGNDVLNGFGNDIANAANDTVFEMRRMG